MVMAQVLGSSHPDMAHMFNIQLSLDIEYKKRIYKT
jgi:hypothetical protein